MRSTPKGFPVGSTTSCGPASSAGVVEDDGQVLVAERGRLLEQVAAWNEASARDFARACAARGRARVVEALRTEGHEEEAR